MGCKKFSQLLLRRSDVEVPDKNVSHEVILFDLPEISGSGMKAEFQKAILIQIAFYKSCVLRPAAHFQLASLWDPSSRRTAQFALLEDS